MKDWSVRYLAASALLLALLVCVCCPVALVSGDAIVGSYQEFTDYDARERLRFPPIELPESAP